MPTDPQRFNLYAYTRNNPLKFIDPEGEAVELTGNEEERRRQLEAARLAVGTQAGAYLYENKGKDGKYYVGVYTNGPDGKGKDFKDLNEVAGEFAMIIADTKVVSLEIVEVGTQVGGYTLTPSESCNCIKEGTVGAAALTVKGADENHFRLLLPMSAKGSAIDPIDPAQMDDGRPGYQDWGTVLGHDLGHARSRMTGGSGQESNDASLRLERKIRRLRDKNAPIPVYHSTAEALKGVKPL